MSTRRFYMAMIVTVVFLLVVAGYGLTSSSSMRNSAPSQLVVGNNAVQGVGVPLSALVLKPTDITRLYQGTWTNSDGVSPGVGSNELDMNIAQQSSQSFSGTCMFNYYYTYQIQQGTIVDTQGDIQFYIVAYDMATGNNYTYLFQGLRQQNGGWQGRFYGTGNINSFMQDIEPPGSWTVTPMN